MADAVENACAADELMATTGLAFDGTAELCAHRYGTSLQNPRDVGTCIARRVLCTDAGVTGWFIPRAGELFRVLAVTPSPIACLDDHGGTGDHVGDPGHDGRPLERCLGTALRDGKRAFDARTRSLAICAATALGCVGLGGDAESACLQNAGDGCRARLARTAFAPSEIGRLCRDPLVSFASLSRSDGGNVAALADACAEVGVPSLSGVDDWLACIERRLNCEAANDVASQVPRAEELFGRVGMALRPPYCPGTAASPTPTVVATTTIVPTSTATVTTTASITSTRTATPSPTPTLTATTLAPTPTPTGNSLTQLGTIVAAVPNPIGGGNKNVEIIRDGDHPPVNSTDSQRQFDTWDGVNTATEDWIGYVYPTSYTFQRVVFQEGINFDDGGWFDSLTVQVRQGGLWTNVTGFVSTPTYPAVNNGVFYETYTLTFDATVGDGIRIYGAPGGSNDFISVAELEVYGAPAGPTATPGGPGATPTRTATPGATGTRTPTPAVTPTRTPSPSASAAPAATATPVGSCDASGAPFGLTTRVPATQCKLDGDPDTAPPLEVERAFTAITFSSPLQLTYAPDGTDRIFVVEQGGKIRVFPNGSPTSATDFLTLSGITVGGEEGLLGLAFHPDYAHNGFFYVYYSAPNPRRSVIARYQVSANPDVADPASGHVILEIPLPYANHHGGQLAFGPDGYLYVSLGDGGSAGDPDNRAQNLGDLLGKILRIDVDHTDPQLAYAVPPDNPFVGQSGARGEIWALGVRNTWRMSFDRLTHALWAGDVGESDWEEVNLIERGGNYGWRRKEGDACYNPSANCDSSAFTPPLVAYPHSQGCAVTGGFVYRGNQLPEIYGAYVYGDYCSGNIWALRYDGTTVTNTLLVDTFLSISSFGEDRDGELYVVSLGGWIDRLRRPTGAQPGTFPRTLSATGCFSDVANRVPAPELVPYDVRAPLWSDGATKRRFMVVPDGTTIGFTASGAWNMPVGTILVKEFGYETERGDPFSERALETRFLVRRADGWHGFSYQWNDAQTEAYLLDNGTTVTFPVSDPTTGATEHTHVFPSRSDCQRCHTSAAGGTLGLRTEQLNRSFTYGVIADNQLRALEHAGFFGGCLPARPAALAALADPADTSAPIANRARSWLQANCAHCHLPGGPAPTTMDLRAEVPPSAMNVCDAVPQHGDLGVSGARIVKPGSAQDSVLWLRAAIRDGANQMPPLATLSPDPLGDGILQAWIDGLSGCP